MGKLVDSTVTFLPAPSNGWNTRDPYPIMPPLNAIEMVNLVPSEWGCALRPYVDGVRDYAIGNNDSVDTIGHFKDSAGNSLWFIAADNTFYSLTAVGQSDIAAPLTITTDLWQWVIFRESAFFCNGVDDIVRITAAGVSSNPAFVGPGGDDKILINVTSYKSRLYFIEGTNIWYGGIDAVTGALTQFDIQSIITRGGKIVIVGSISLSSAVDIQEAFFVITDQGEGLIYTGDNPGSATWTLQSRFFIPRPMGVRCYTRMGADAIILTEVGPISLSKVLAARYGTPKEFLLDDQIQPTFATSTSTYHANSGWSLTFVPTAGLLFCNIPVNSPYSPGVSAYSEQYVYNILSNAWCKFNAVEAICFNYSATFDIVGSIPTITFGGRNGRVGIMRFSEVFAGDGFDLDLDDVFGGRTDVINDQYFIQAFNKFDSVLEKKVEGVQAMIARSLQYSATVSLYQDYDPSTFSATSQAVTAVKTGLDTYQYFHVFHNVGVIDEAIAIGISVKDPTDTNLCRILGVNVMYKIGGTPQ